MIKKKCSLTILQSGAERKAHVLTAGKLRYAIPKDDELVVWTGILGADLARHSDRYSIIFKIWRFRNYQHGHVLIFPLGRGGG